MEIIEKKKEACDWLFGESSGKLSGRTATKFGGMFFVAKTDISTKFPYFSPLRTTFKIPEKTMITHLYIYLFADVKNNPEMSFLVLSDLFSH